MDGWMHACMYVYVYVYVYVYMYMYIYIYACHACMIMYCGWKKSCTTLDG